MRDQSAFAHEESDQSILHQMIRHVEEVLRGQKRLGGDEEGQATALGSLVCGLGEYRRRLGAHTRLGSRAQSMRRRERAKASKQASSSSNSGSGGHEREGWKRCVGASSAY